MKEEGILKRISAITGIDRLVEKLALLSQKDWQSLLLYAFEERAGRLSVNHLLDQVHNSRFTQPSALSQRAIVGLEHNAINLLPQEFEAIELSPVVPFGTNRILAGTNQKNILSTSRNLEVTADPTTALALECARRRSQLIRNSSTVANPVRLATIQRNIRLQSFEKIPGFMPHFKVLALETAGCEKPDWPFKIASLLEHLTYYLRFICFLIKSGYHFQGVIVNISNIRIAEKIIQNKGLSRKEVGRETQNSAFSIFEAAGISFPSIVSDLRVLDVESQFNYGIKYFIDALKEVEEAIVTPMKSNIPDIYWEFDLERIAGMGYYTDLCFKITAKNRLGYTYPLIDGGFVDWTQKLLLSKKEQLLISGVGLDILLQNFHERV
ncbi:MAG: hypothetical protein FJZ04_00600 [Candidatus Moranbacteria bacterium]|nr:hypothetical protein [Candidatus Moranbacteria bacterium]